MAKISQNIVKAKDDEFNTQIIKQKKYSVIYSLEANKKNTIKHTDSGLNENLASLASKNDIAIGIDFEEIKTLDKKEKAERLSRIFQNIKICKKKNTRLATRGKDAFFILNSLGASTKQAKEASSQYF